MMTTVVLDTNLLIAGRWNKKSSSLKIIESVISGELNAVYSPRIRDENLFILEKVKTPREYLDRIFKFMDCSQIVHPKTRADVSRDKSDNMYLDAAVEGKADYVISNDIHLLELKEYMGVKILRPGEFMKENWV